MVFPTFFNLSLNLAIRSSWSEPQSAPGLVFPDCIELFHLWLQRIYQSDISIAHQVMSMCRVFSCCWKRMFAINSAFSRQKSVSLWPAHFVLQGQICLLLQVFLDFLLFHSSPQWWKGHLFGVLVLKTLVVLHRTVQLQLLQHYWLGHRLGLLWYWMICFGKKPKISLSFLRCTQVLHCGPFYWLEGYSISSKGFLPTVVDIMVIWVKFTHSNPF